MCFVLFGFRAARQPAGTDPAAPVRTSSLRALFARFTGEAGIGGGDAPSAPPAAAPDADAGAPPAAAAPALALALGLAAVLLA